MNDDIHKYLPDASAVQKVADPGAAKERMRKALRSDKPPAVARDAPQSGRKRLPGWLVAAGAITAVLLPTSLALLLSAPPQPAKEAIAAPDATGTIGAMPQLPARASAALFGTSSAGAPTVSAAVAPTVTASARGDPNRQGVPKKKQAPSAPPPPTATPSAAPTASAAPSAAPAASEAPTPPKIID